jgi:hypothetical protein
VTAVTLVWPLRSLYASRAERARLIEWMQRAYVSLHPRVLPRPGDRHVTLGQKHNDTDWQYNTADPDTRRVC